MSEQTDPLSFDLFAELVGPEADISFIYISQLSTHREVTRIGVQIADWFVPPPLRKRGIGSVLLSEAILQCRLRGVDRITGDLLDRDNDHFDQLAHMYRMHDFDVNFFAADTIEYRRYKNTLGVVELIL